MLKKGKKGISLILVLAIVAAMVVGTFVTINMVNTNNGENVSKTSLKAEDTIKSNAAKGSISFVVDRATVKVGEIIQVSFRVDNAKLSRIEYDDNYVRAIPNVGIVASPYISIEGKKAISTTKVTLYVKGNDGKEVSDSIDINVKPENKDDSPAKDTTAPTCTITASGVKEGALTNKSKITYNIKFSENVTGFTKEDITVKSGTKKDFSGSGSEYKLVVESKDKTVYTQVVSIAANVCKDAAGNGNKTAKSTIKIDTEHPQLASFKLVKVNGKEITNEDKLVYVDKSTKLEFELKIKDKNYKKDTELTKDNFQINVGDTKDTNKADISVKTKSSTTKDATYTVILSNIQEKGNVNLILKSGALKDSAGNKNAVYTYSKHEGKEIVSTVTKNVINPRGVEEGKLTNKATITYDIYLGEGATEFEQEDITVTGGTIKSFTGSGSSYKLVVTSKENSAYEQVVSIDENKYKDGDGAGNKAAKSTIKVDTENPYTTQLKLVKVDGNDFTDENATVRITKDTKLEYELKIKDTNFDKDVDLKAENFQINVGTKTNVNIVPEVTKKESTDEGATYTIKLTNIEDEGNVDIILKSGAFKDKAGNNNKKYTYSAHEGRNVVILQGTSVIVPIGVQEGGLTNSAEVKYLIDFGEDVTEFEQEDISLTGEGTIKSFTGSGRRYELVVTSKENSSYEQVVSIDANKYKNSDGTGNKAVKSTIKIDTERPHATQLKLVKVDDKEVKDESTIKISKNTKLEFELKLADTNFNKDMVLKPSNIRVDVGNTQNTKKVTKKVTKKESTDTGATYSIILKDIEEEGSVDVILRTNMFEDNAGNLNKKYTYSKKTGNVSIVSGEQPTIEKAVLSESTGNTYDNITYVKNGSLIVVSMKFSTRLSVLPTVKITDGKTTVDAAVLGPNGTDNTYVATYHIGEGENNENCPLEEGNLYVKISDYKDEKGITGEEYECEFEIIYDKTKPTIDQIDYNGNEPNSGKWVQSQTVTVTTTDNITPTDKLDYQYMWICGDNAEQMQKGVSGQPITKKDGTGAYKLLVQIKDYAGNITSKLLGTFNIDTDVSSNEMGVVRITKNSAEGEEYIPLVAREEGNEKAGYYVREDMIKEGTDEKGNKYKYYEGKYTKDELYIHKIDGAGKEGEESGEEETKYKVYYKAENGEYKEIAVGDKTTEDTILYNDNTYKIVVTTKDKAGNEREEIYIVHKGAGNITFNPNGSEEPVGVARTTVTLVDEETKYRWIKYKWVKEGEETEDGYIENKGWEEYKKGVEIETPSGVAKPYDGKYELWIQTLDEEGNVNVVKSKTFNIKGKIEKEGTIEFRENSKEGEELKPDEKREIETKENVWIKITEQGEDPYGEVETTFEIKGPDGKTVGYGTKEIAVLTQEGKYEVRLTSKRVNKEKPELEVENKTIYKVTIDKTGPEVTFKDVTQEGAQRGQIEVTIKDEITGLEEDEIKYVWKRGSTKPSKEEFDGIEDNGVRGKVELKEGKATITTPENMGDVWTLWIYAKDKVGNESIVKEPNKGDNQTNEDSEAPIAGRLEITQIKENNEEEKYETEENQDGIEEGKCTKEKLRLKLKNGYDAGSGIKSNTYTITKDGKEIEKEITEEREIEEHGTYEITVKTEDNAGHEATRTYKITIDKKGPQIKLKPDGNSEYAKQHKVKVEITEPEEESGVQEEKTKYIWVGYDPEKIETKEEMVNKIKQYVEEKIKENTEDKNTEEKANTENTEGKEEGTPTQKQITKEEYIKMLLKEEVIKELEQQGIYVEEGKAEGGVIATPEGKTGIYHLIVYGEDKLGNSTMIISEMYKIDNENPSKPEIEGSKKQIVGTKEEEVRYNGERTNKEVTVTAKNSKSQSGVDKYEVSYTKDEGKTWSNWEDATVKEDQKGEIQGKITIKDEGKTVVKFRSIAKLLDVTEEGKEAKEVELISEETEEYVVTIDKEGPKVTYENTENGENGSKESIEKIKVRPTVVDEAGVEKSTLKYRWVKFESVEEYNEFQKAEKTIEQLKEKMGEGKTFSNGEEIPSPENIEGIYSLFVYAKDKIGNESVSYSEYYAFKLGKDEKSEYVLAGEYITKVKPETKVEDFIEKVKAVVAGSTYEVYDKKGNEIEEGKIVTTASTVKVDGKTYTIIVVGDLNGDGKLTGTDLVQMRFSRVGKYELKGAYEKAADINNDGKITGTDLVQMRLIKVGLADYTE